MEEMVHAPIKSYFNNINLTKIYPEIFQLLWYSQLPCFSIPDLDTPGLLSHCTWAGETFDCKELFQTIPTDSGMCCAFNMDLATLRDSLYKDLIQDMKEENNEREQMKDYRVNVGKKSGLTIMLDNHYNSVTFGSVFDDALGMQVYVGEKEEFPMVKQREKMLAPVREHFLEISGHVVESDEKLKSRLSPSKGRCLFRDESKLTFFYKYTSHLSV